MRRLVRTLRGHDLMPPVRVKCRKIRLGNDGANWSICPDDLHEKSVVYSFGVGTDISFDLELIRRFGVTVHAFDPTPRSVAWLRQQSLPGKFVFHEVGLGALDGVAKFSAPENIAHVSFSMARSSLAPSVVATVRRLSTIMSELGHSRIDLLKIDIEGAEYDVLADVLSSGISIGQLLVEFHHRWPEIDVSKTQDAIHLLNEAGFSLFDVSAAGEEYSFKQQGASQC